VAEDLRILHIGKYFYPHAGGMENYLCDLMVTLTKLGVDNHALVHASELCLRGSEGPIEIRGSRMLIVRAATWLKLMFTPISPGFPFLLRSMLGSQQPQILHIHMPNVSAFWVLFSRRARKAKWVVHWHSDVVTSRDKPALSLFYSLYRPFERALLKRCDRIVVTSPPYLENSEPLATVRDRCTVIPLGLDPERLPPGVASQTRNEALLRVLAVGRLTYYKGFEHLLRACAQCPGVDVHLVGAGEELGTLRSLSKELGVDSRVTFHGALSDPELAEQYAACDCLCLPSIERTEAFGIVLLEAMLFERACVVSDVKGSGMSWVVEDGVTGYTVPPGDSAALAGQLEAMGRERIETRRLGHEARLAFDRRFHIQRSAEAVLRLYRELIPVSTSAASSPD
jgi:glycosyltransferase involved in cell wall biosynthesis